MKVRTDQTWSVPPAGAPGAVRVDPLDRIATALERIADVLEGFEPVGEEHCIHPAEKRTDLSTMGNVHWSCACGFEFGKAAV